MTYYIIIRGPAAGGKTTISKKLAAKLHAHYISFDKIRERTGLGFSEEDRIKANEVALPEAKEKLDRIVHPPLLRRLRVGIQEALREDEDRPVVVDAALIVEWGIEDWFDTVVAVRTPERMQIERLVRRNGLSGGIRSCLRIISS